jgi:predicted nucleic acid-binding protein
MEPLVPMWEMEEMEYADEEDEIEAEGEEEGVEAEEITLADGTTVYYVEDNGLCYSVDGDDLGSYNSDTNSLEELNLTP